jgi:hypothetical protein
MEVPLPSAFEFASYAVTEGEVVKFVPLTAVDEGWVVNASEFRAPGAIEKVATQDELRVPSVARIDWTEVFRILSPEKLTTPELFEGEPVTEEATSAVQAVSE